MHDPDSYTVIAPSFDAFLQERLSAGFDWIEAEEEVQCAPDWLAFLQALRAQNPEAEQKLQHPFYRGQISLIMREAPTPAVLRACLAQLDARQAALTEETGERPRLQYACLLDEFYTFSHVYLQDAALREEVAAFALKVKNHRLIQQLGLEMDDKAVAELFRDSCWVNFLAEQYKTLSPEEFFKQSVLAWELPCFDEYFDHLVGHYNLMAYVYGTRERRIRFDARWKERLHGCACLSLVQFGLLAELAETVEDIERLKARLLDVTQADIMQRLARFCHALCLVGEEQVDAYLPWVFDQLVAALEANADLEKACYSPGVLTVVEALNDIKSRSSWVYCFGFIVSLRPELSLDLLARMAPMLTDETNQKACASLVRLLKKRIKEAGA